MSRRRSVPLAAALAGLAAACPPTPPPGTPMVELPACFQFERDPGARALGLPWGFVLEDASLAAAWPLVADRPGVRRAQSALSATERADHPFGYWAMAGTDSIELGHPGGGGLVLTLARAGQDLIGSGVAAGDAVPLGGTIGPRPPHPVIARRVLCGAR